MSGSSTRTARCCADSSSIRPRTTNRCGSPLPSEGSDVPETLRHHSRGGGGTRTLTGDGLSALPLPIGLHPRAPILDPERHPHEDVCVADDLGRVDLTNLDTFANGFPHGVFRLHREVAPVWCHEPTVNCSGLACPA